MINILSILKLFMSKKHRNWANFWVFWWLLARFSHFLAQNDAKFHDLGSFLAIFGRFWKILFCQRPPPATPRGSNRRFNWWSRPYSRSSSCLFAPFSNFEVFRRFYGQNYGQFWPILAIFLAKFGIFQAWIHDLVKNLSEVQIFLHLFSQKWPKMA